MHTYLRNIRGRARKRKRPALPKPLRSSAPFSRPSPPLAPLFKPPLRSPPFQTPSSFAPLSKPPLVPLTPRSPLPLLDRVRPARSVNRPGPTRGAAGPAGATRLRVGPSGGRCGGMLIPAGGAAGSPETAALHTTVTQRRSRKPTPQPPPCAAVSAVGTGAALGGLSVPLAGPAAAMRAGGRFWCACRAAVAQQRAGWPAAACRC